MFGSKYTGSIYPSESVKVKVKARQESASKNIFGSKYTGSIHPSSLVRRHLMSAGLMWETTNNTHFSTTTKRTLKTQKI